MNRGLPRPFIALVTHGERLVARADATPEEVEERIVAQVREAAAAGVDLVQVREIDREGAALLGLVERCVAAARGSRLRVVVNDRLDVAVAAGAHGVHLRGDSYPVQRVRGFVGAGFLVGRSVHDPDEAAAVARDGVDYLLFGTVFPTGSKGAGRRPAGIDGLEAVVRSAHPIPVLAIGGVSVRSAPLLVAAGAAGVAAIGLFFPGEGGASGSIARTVADLRAAFDTAIDPH